ncbi:flippase, partial [Geobacillus subterraneus]|uniref:flippase n=1 Tax=Geobacillus subterraneus TaxID=129338 RepID=UPI00179FD06F
DLSFRMMGRTFILKEIRQQGLFLCLSEFYLASRVSSKMIFQIVFFNKDGSDFNYTHFFVYFHQIILSELVMNMNLILKNATYLFTSNVILRLFSALTSVLVARYLGANDYGILSLALAISSIAGYFIDMGLSHTFIREATKDDKVDLVSLVGGHFKLRIVFALIVAIFLFIVVELLYSDSYVKKVIYLMVYPTIIGASLQGVGAVYFQAIQQMHYTALIRSFSAIVTAATLILGLIFKWSLLLLAPVYGFSSVFGGILSVFLLSRKTPLFKGWDRNLLNGLLGYTFGGLLIMILPQVPPIILEKVTDLEQVGYFSAAYRIPSILYQIPGVVAAAFYPMLFKYGSTKQYEKHLEMSVMEAKIMTLLGGCMILPFLFYSKWWINTIFGTEWEEIAPLLSIISIMVLLQSINFPLADSLTTKGHQIKRTTVMFITLLLAIVCHYFLGKRFNAVGGATTVLITELLLLVGFTLFNKKTSVQILQKGVLSNGIAFILTISLGLTVYKFFYPILGSIVLVIVFTLLAVTFDKKLLLLLFNVFKDMKNANRNT